MSLNTLRLLCLCSVLLVGVGCSKEDDPLAKEGEACAVDADCESNLACRMQVCVMSGDTDMGGNDTPDGGNNVAPNSTVVQNEDFIISYILRDRDSTDTLWIYDTDTGVHTKVTPEGDDCRLGCWVSASLGHYITTQANGPNFDVEATALTGSYALNGNAQPIAVDVRRVEVIGDAVTYVREDAGENKAYYRPLDGANEILLGLIGAVNTTEGDWHLDPQSNKGVVYNATLQTMDVKIGDLGSEVSTLAYTLDGSNYQETSGSYFGGSIPTAFSQDGKRMALVTQKAPNNYNNCENESECTGPGQRCGRFGRCSAIEVAVHMFDLDNLDNLGGPCSADDSCGTVHTCDIPADDAVDQAVCVPRRVVLGLPGSQMQNMQTGCALTDGNDDYFYTDVRGPISFGADGGLYLTAARDCGDANIQHTDILRLTTTSSEYTVVFGNQRTPFDPDACYSDVEESVDVTNCKVWVQNARISPGGNALAFIATNPNVIEPQLAQSNVDLWTVKRNGLDHAWVGEHAELDVVRSFMVHAQQ